MTAQNESRVSGFEELYAFIEGNFDYLLVVDERGVVLHSNPLLRRTCSTEETAMPGQRLAEVLTGESLQSFAQAIGEAERGQRGVALFTPAAGNACSLPLKTEIVRSARGPIRLFYGRRIDAMAVAAEWEKNERIKELFCVYAVAERLRAAASPDEFFHVLPGILALGLRFPEQAVVRASYLGTTYGRERPPRRSIGVRLVVGQQDAGEIRVGYLDEGMEFLADERALLDLIGSMTSMTFERQQFAESLRSKQTEEDELASRLVARELEIEARTKELEDQTRRLGMIDSCLGQVTRDWEESKARLQTLFEAIPDDVVLIDRQRNVVMTNRSGFVGGRKCHEVFFLRDTPCEDCRLERIIRGKAPLSAAIRDGDRYLQVQATPVFDNDHEVHAIVEFYRDVTLEKVYEQQIRQAEKLAALGQLVSGVGHEINNPNQFIRGNIKILRQALEDILPILDSHHAACPDLKIARLKYPFFREHVLTLVDDIAHGSERIKQIVEALRGFARQDDGLLLDCVQMNTIVEATVRLVENEVRKRAQVCLDLGENIPTFMGNSQKIEQVLVNMIVNAGQAMKEDRPGRIVIGTRADDRFVVIKVEDNGCGMSEKTMKQIFEPFFTTKRAKGGTGLGLAVTYRIVEEHGGVISVASEIGRGTVFTAKIPWARAEAPVAQSATQSSAQSAAQSAAQDAAQDAEAT
jgi:signal transduction histidine kinase